MALRGLIFLLCRASKNWAYDDERIHPGLYLGRGHLNFLGNSSPLPWDGRKRAATTVEVAFRASLEGRRKRIKIDTFRKRLAGARDEKTPSTLELMLKLPDLHHDQSAQVPLVQTRSGTAWKAVTRNEAALILRQVSITLVKTHHSMRSLGENSWSHQLGGIRSNTAGKPEGGYLEIQKADRWKSRAPMIYVQHRDEGAEFVSRALAHHKWLRKEF